MDRRTTKRSAAALLRLAPAPAERAHICQGLVFRTEAGDQTVVTVALGYSHAVWAEFCIQVGESALPVVLEHAWEFFGGAPRTWVFEATSPAALRQPDLVELAERWRAVVRPVDVCDPVPWGEWALRRVPERLLRRSLLRDLGLANRLLRASVEEMLWRDHPAHPGRQVHDVLEEERGYLWRTGLQ
jgi:hypothetical protein